MEYRFTSDEWKALTPAQRVRRCHLMAEEVQALATGASADLRLSYTCIAEEWMKLAGVVSGGCLLLVIVAALKNAEVRGQAAVGQGDIGLIEHLGKALFTEYVIPFEISSVLFLSAMVGAVVVGKKGD